MVHVFDLSTTDFDDCLRAQRRNLFKCHRIQQSYGHRDGDGDGTTRQHSSTVHTARLPTYVFRWPPLNLSTGGGGGGEGRIQHLNITEI